MRITSEMIEHKIACINASDLLKAKNLWLNFVSSNGGYRIDLMRGSVTVLTLFHADTKAMCQEFLAGTENLIILTQD